MLPSASRFSRVHTASTLQKRTLSAPAAATRPRLSATPGSQTSSERTLDEGRAAARAAVASPTPPPISTMSGASRPNQVVQPNPGSSTASSGTTHRSAYSSQAACCFGVNRLPRRA